LPHQGDSEHLRKKFFCGKKRQKTFYYVGFWRFNVRRAAESQVFCCFFSKKKFWLSPLAGIFRAARPARRVDSLVAGPVIG
jgi:hypothetical protein